MRVLSPSPRTLLALGLALFALAALVDLLFYGGHRQSVPQPAATAPARPGPTPLAPAAGAAPSAFAATLTWRTRQPAEATVRWGPTGAEPVLWARVRRVARSHSFTLFGLVPATAYRAEIDATARDGTPTRFDLAFTTSAAPAQSAALVRHGVLFVDGSPFFPLIAWQECQPQWAADVADGIDLFAGGSCGGLGSLLGSLQGHAVAAGTSNDAPASGPGLVGWFYPDEADGRGLTAASLSTPPVGGVRFLTLTNHFFSGAAPLPAGRAMYPSLVARADVVGFDLYPLQEWCNPAALGDVFDAQRQLVALAQGRPTYQWIEVRQMNCPTVPVTPADIEAESWLAIAGGAQGLGFFPAGWNTSVGAVIHDVAVRVRQLGPVLLQPALPVEISPAGSPVRASARELDGALYVIAVNPTSRPVPATLQAPDLGDRTLELLGRGRTMTARDGAVTDTLPPLGVRIYVATP